jgi:hypothetical protein
MSRGFKVALASLTILTGALPVPAQCGFFSKPVAGFTWYRAEGWPTPGVEDAKATVPLNAKGRPYGWPEGLTVSQFVHELNHHIVFPSTIFEENGERKRTQPAAFILTGLWRWEMDGKPYAYTYTILSDTVACGFSMDLIDNRGDGKFRLMQSSDHGVTGYPPLPAWAAQPKS